MFENDSVLEQKKRISYPITSFVMEGAVKFTFNPSQVGFDGGFTLVFGFLYSNADDFAETSLSKYVVLSPIACAVK